MKRARQEECREGKLPGGGIVYNTNVSTASRGPFFLRAQCVFHPNITQLCFSVCLFLPQNVDSTTDIGSLHKTEGCGSLSGEEADRGYMKRPRILEQPGLHWSVHQKWRGRPSVFSGICVLCRGWPPRAQPVVYRFLEAEKLVLHGHSLTHCFLFVFLNYFLHSCFYSCKPYTLST